MHGDGLGCVVVSVKLSHHIYASNEREAEALAGMFEGDGYAVRWARHRPGSFIELEVSNAPAAFLAARLRPDDP